MPKIGHILVIRLSAMGDVAMTVPVIRIFREQYPEVELTILTKPFFKPLFDNIPNCKVVTANTKHDHKGLLGLWKLSRTLRTLKFEAVADLHNVLRSKILRTFLLGKNIAVIDKGRSEKKALTNGTNVVQLKSTHQRYADVFDKLGYPIDLSNPVFSNRAKLSSEVIKVIGEEPLKWIGIAPFAAFDGKQYPVSLMHEVIKELSKDHKILLFGAGNEEADQLQNWQDEFKNVINLAGVFSFKEELEIISNLDIMLSMDSGNAHLAAMYGVKVITLWGVTHPYAGFLPFAQSIDSALLSDRIQYPNIPTSIYGNKVPEGYENVLSSIRPQDVVSKIRLFLN